MTLVLLLLYSSVIPVSRVPRRSVHQPLRSTEVRATQRCDRAGVLVSNLSPNYMTRSLCVRGDRFRVKIRSILLRCRRDTAD